MRFPQEEIDAMFIDRWSPRAFLAEEIPEHQIKSLFEAGRWSPSCFNEQPWVFIYACKKPDRERFLDILNEKNRSWADKAPLLVFALYRRNFKHNGKINRHAGFDTGAAWMSLALQARKMGLYAHAMAGFNQKKAYAALGVPEAEYDIIAAIAVGRKASAEILENELREIEKPNERKPLEQVCYEGKLPDNP